MSALRKIWSDELKSANERLHMYEDKLELLRSDKSGVNSDGTPAIITTHYLDRIAYYTSIAKQAREEISKPTQES